MRYSKFVMIGSAVALLLGACGGGDSGSVPSRDELVAEIVEKGGVDKDVAECAADALFDNLSKDDLKLVVAGEEPSAKAKDSFTDAILDCLSDTEVTDETEAEESTTTDAPATSTTDAPTTTAVAGSVSQWATTAEATSQYGEDSWSATQATGEPNSPDCADQTTAWATEKSDGNDTLTLGYDTPVIPSAVRISITYTPNQIVSVDVVGTDGTVTSVYTGAPSEETCPQLFEVPVTGVTSAVDEVRITLDQSILALGWTEIDAVELVGTES
jgi:hypothetical protein